MKKIFTLTLSAVALLSSFATNAQSFSVTSDTVHFTYTGTAIVNVPDSIVVPSGGPNVTLKWDVINTNFPSDWRGGLTGICDNQLCYSGTSFWGALTTLRTSSPYTAGSNHGDYHMQLGLATATTTGTYYLTAHLYNSAAPTDTADVTFMITYAGPSSVANVGYSNEEILLYPNPATKEINLVYDAIPDVKMIAVYNIIGKVMSVYKVSGSSANLDMETIPTGIYFARLMNAQGDVLATRKFTKQ